MPAVIVQPAWAPEKLQLVPGSVGKVSETVTFFATPVPELVTVFLKPICSPALTTLFPYTTLFRSDGQFTSSDAEASWPFATVGVVTPSLEAATEAALETEPQVAEVGVDTTCAEVEPVARSAGP